MYCMYVCRNKHKAMHVIYACIRIYYIVYKSTA